MVLILDGRKTYFSSYVRNIPQSANIVLPGETLEENENIM